MSLARCRRRTGTVCRMRGRKRGRGSLHPGMRGHGGRGRGRGRKGPVPKRDQSGMREPTAFDGDPPGRRASCVQQLAAQPKEPVTDGVCAAPWQLQCLCRLMQTLTVSAARCRRKRFSVGGDDEQAATCASGAAGAGPDGPASAASGDIDPADRCARLAALPAKKWFIPEAKIAEWLGCEDSSALDSCAAR